MDPLQTLKNIYDVAKLIYDYAELVKGNSAQCKRLADRVRIVTTALHKLDKQKDLEQYKKALEALHQCLVDIREFVKQFTEAKWYLRIIKAQNYQPKINEFNKHLEEAINQLNLGLNAQQIINHEQDKADQAADQAALKEQYEKILNLMQDETRENQQFRGDMQDGQEILRKQLDSVQRLVQYAVTGKHVKLPIDAHFVASWVDILCQEKIADGSFGKVYKALWKNQPIAVKVIEGVVTPDAQAQFTREIQMSKNIK
jgi:hypothetical protein